MPHLHAQDVTELSIAMVCAQLRGDGAKRRELVS